MKIPVTLNDESVMLEADADTLLSHILRRLNPASVKCGCGDGLCGACAVLLDGVPVLSCLLPAAAVRDADIVTFDYFRTTADADDIQQGFEQAGVQLCGYCDAGKFFAAHHLLHPQGAMAPAHPSRKDIAEALGQLRCHCADVDFLVNGVLYASAIRQKRVEEASNGSAH